MTDHLTPQMLALYLGCDVMMQSEPDSKEPYIEKLVGVCEWACYTESDNKQQSVSIENVKLILRPTHTINYDDALKYVTAMYPQWQVEVIEVEKENKNRTRGFWYRYNSGRRWSKKYWMFHWALPISTQTVTHLLKERFDLYDWIEKGLAIDATKIKKP